MSCCNSKRQSVSTHQPSEVRYRYVGLSSLTVYGSATGKVYHFTKQGDEILIDGRDTLGMSSVPNVRRVLA